MAAPLQGVASACCNAVWSQAQAGVTGSERVRRNSDDADSTTMTSQASIITVAQDAGSESDEDEHGSFLHSLPALSSSIISSPTRVRPSQKKCFGMPTLMSSPIPDDSIVSPVMLELSPSPSSLASSPTFKLTTSPAWVDCNDSARCTYKELERVACEDKASKKVARLCTDILFAAVVQQADRESSEQASETGLNTMAQKMGMGEQMQNLVQASRVEIPSSPWTWNRLSSGWQGSERQLQQQAAAQPESTEPITSPRPLLELGEAAQPFIEAHQEVSDSSVQVEVGTPALTETLVQPGPPRRPVPKRPSKVPSSVTFRRQRSSSAGPAPPIAERSAGGPSQAMQRRRVYSADAREDTLEQTATTKAASIAEIHRALRSTHHGGITALVFGRFCFDCFELNKICNFTTSSFSMACADDIFAMVVQPGERNINVQQFEAGLSYLSDRIDVDSTMLQQTAAAVAAPDLRAMAAKRNRSPKKASSSSSPALASPIVAEAEPWFKRASFAPSFVKLQKPPEHSPSAPCLQSAPSASEFTVATCEVQIAEAVAVSAEQKGPGKAGELPNLRDLPLRELTNCKDLLSLRAPLSMAACPAGYLQSIPNLKDSPVVRAPTSASPLHSSCSAACPQPSPSTPPPEGKRPRPRPLGPLALAEVADVKAETHTGDRNKRITDLLHELSKVTPNASSARSRAVMGGLIGTTLQQSKAFVSPSHESDASTATPMGSAQFGSPPPSSQPSPQADGMVAATPTGFRRCASQSPATAPQQEETLISPPQQSEGSSATPTGLLQFDSPHQPSPEPCEEPSPEPAAQDHHSAAKASGIDRCAMGGSKLSRHLVQVTGGSVAKQASSTPPSVQRSHSLPSPSHSKAPSSYRKFRPQAINIEQQEDRKEPAFSPAVSPQSSSMGVRSATDPSLAKPVTLFRRPSNTSLPIVCADSRPHRAGRTFNIADAYTSFCSGDKGVSCKGFAKLCHQVGIATEVPMATMVRSVGCTIFDQVLPKGKRHMNLQQFDRAVSLLAEIHHVGEDMLRQRIETSGVALPTPLSADPANEGSHSFQPAKRTSLLRPLCSLSRSPSCALLSPSPAKRLLSSRCLLAPSADMAEQELEKVTDPSSITEETAATRRDSACPDAARRDSGSSEETLLVAFPAAVEEHEDPLLLLFEANLHKLPRRREVAEAKDALDVALLYGAEAMKREVAEDQKAHAKNKASDALALALLAEARDTGIEISRSGLLKARVVAQGALDFTFLTERNLDIDAQSLDELKAHAQDAVQVGLLAMQRAEDSSDEAPSPRMQASAPQELEQVLDITSRMLWGRLCQQSVEDARQCSRDALTRAVWSELQCSGMEIAPEELQLAMERAFLAVDSVALGDARCAGLVAGNLSLVRRRALNALHLALLDVSISS